MSFERDARCKHGETNSGGSGGCPECFEEEFGNPFINELREDQKKYWPAVQWLAEPHIHRARGRSTMLALAFIEQADLHIGTAVVIWDHYPHQRDVDEMIHRINTYLHRFREEYPSWTEKEFLIGRPRATLTRIK